MFTLAEQSDLSLTAGLGTVLSRVAHRLTLVTTLDSLLVAPDTATVFKKSVTGNDTLSGNMADFLAFVAAFKFSFTC